MRYDDGVAAPDVSYSYADAVRDGICRPVTFVPYDGVLQWRSGEELVESSFADAVTAREAGRRYRTAISLELADGLPRILAAAHERLEQVRADGHRDAGGLVVAADGEHARAVAKALRAITGRPPTVVLHTEARAAEKLQAFTRSSERWLVAVNMVSEGVDIPRLRVGVYATAAKTPLIFRQIVGRFVRTLPGRARSSTAGSSCPPTRSCARTPPRSSASCATSCARRASDEGFALDEVDERRQTERGEAEAFVPVAADVAPQMALFGGGPPPPPAPAVPVGARRARRGDDAGLRAPRAAARQAPPAGGRPAPQPGRHPRRDQPLAEPLLRRAPRRGRVDRPARALDRAAAGPPLR